MHRHFATVCSRITQFFLLKCLEKITVYKSMQNLYQLVIYSLINSRNWIHAISDVTLHVNKTPLTVEDRLLIKTSYLFSTVQPFSVCEINFEYCDKIFFIWQPVREVGNYSKSMNRPTGDIFTAEHEMQTRFSDENSVRLSVRPSVCQTRAL